VRRIARAVGGDRIGHGFRIASLVDGNHLVVALALIEPLGERVDAIVVASGLRMPPLDLDHGLRLPGEAEERREQHRA
jgi:hypothetical protein